MVGGVGDGKKKALKMTSWLIFFRAFFVFNKTSKVNQQSVLNL